MQQTDASFESIRATLREVAQAQKDSRSEWDKMMKEAEEKRQKSSADFDRRMEEFQKKMDGIADSQKELQKKIGGMADSQKELQKTVGGMAYNQGQFAEEYFFNSFENGKKNFFGERFDKIKRGLTNFWQGIEDEYDIVLYNHTSVAIIEAKYKAHKNDIPSVLKKAETFKILFPQYKDFKIYLGLASMSFYPALEQECIKQGIAIIKQIGDTVVISDEHLKVF